MSELTETGGEYILSLGLNVNEQMIYDHTQDTKSKLKNVSLLKLAVFWVVAPCSLVEFYWGFRGTCCLHHQGDE
jgi:hypothetical protein